MSKKAIRRHHKYRIRRKARRVALSKWDFAEEGLVYADRISEHLKVCSRPCCGNPRRNGWLSREQKATRQERLSSLEMAEQSNDL